MTPNPHTLLKKCDSIQGPSRHSSAHHSMFYPFSFFSAYQQTCHLATFYQFILAHQVDAVWHPPEAANRTLSLGGLNMTSNISRMAAHQKKDWRISPKQKAQQWDVNIHNIRRSTSTFWGCNSSIGHSHLSSLPLGSTWFIKAHTFVDNVNAWDWTHDISITIQIWYNILYIYIYYILCIYILYTLCDIIIWYLVST